MFHFLWSSVRVIQYPIVYLKSFIPERDICHLKNCEYDCNTLTNWASFLCFFVFWSNISQILICYFEILNTIKMFFSYFRRWIQSFGMKPFIFLFVVVFFVFVWFSYPTSVRACRCFRVSVWQSEYTQSLRLQTFRFKLPPYYVTFHWVSLSPIRCHGNFFLLALALASLWVF